VVTDVPLRGRILVVNDDLEKKLRDLQRKQRELTLAEREVSTMERELKANLLAGATVDPGTRCVELRVLPGRDPSSRNPDDYELVITYVS